MSNLPLVCQTCNGTGVVTWEEDCYNQRAERHYTRSRHEDCEDCRGTGDQKCTYCANVAVDTYLEKPVCEECDNQAYQGFCSYCGEPAKYNVGLVLVCQACKDDFDDPDREPEGLHN